MRSPARRSRNRSRAGSGGRSPRHSPRSSAWNCAAWSAVWRAASSGVCPAPEPPSDRGADPLWRRDPVVQPLDEEGTVPATDELSPADAQMIDAFVSHLALERRLSPNTVAGYRRDVEALAVFPASG